jgi:hypothetical protein
MPVPTAEEFEAALHEAWSEAEVPTIEKRLEPGDKRSPEPPVGWTSLGTYTRFRTGLSGVGQWDLGFWT